MCDNTIQHINRGEYLFFFVRLFVRWGGDCVCNRLSFIIISKELFFYVGMRGDACL